MCATVCIFISWQCRKLLNPVTGKLTTVSHFWFAAKLSFTEFDFDEANHLFSGNFLHFTSYLLICYSQSALFRMCFIFPLLPFPVGALSTLSMSPFHFWFFIPSLSTILSVCILSSSSYLTILLILRDCVLSRVWAIHCFRVIMVWLIWLHLHLHPRSSYFILRTYLLVGSWEDFCLRSDLIFRLRMIK